MKNLFLKNWPEIFTFFFIFVSFFLYVWVFTNCGGPGCLFGFALICICLFTAFIFLITSFFKKRFVVKNIILAIIFMVFSVILSNQIRISSRLSDFWQEYNHAERCSIIHGSWNYANDYCDVLQTIEKDCKLMKTSVPLWNSSGYEAIIPYKVCGDNKISFSLDGGEKLILHNKGSYEKIMEFSKIAPETIETAIRLTAYGDNDLPAGCLIKKVDTPNRWIISSSEENQIDCGEYAQPYDDSIVSYFTVLNDFVLVFIDVPEDNLIDFDLVEVRVIR